MDTEDIRIFPQNRKLGIKIQTNCNISIRSFQKIHDSSFSKMFVINFFATNLLYMIID